MGKLSERNRIRYGRAGAKSILGLYVDFTKYIERYNYIVYRMDTLASYMSQLSENDKKYIDYLDEYNESYDRYLELSIEFDLPVETEISSKSRIYAFSHETFYRVVKEFKKNMWIGLEKNPVEAFWEKCNNSAIILNC